MHMHANLQSRHGSLRVAGGNIGLIIPNQSRWNPLRWMDGEASGAEIRVCVGVDGEASRAEIRVCVGVCGEGVVVFFFPLFLFLAGTVRVLVMPSKVDPGSESIVT